MPIQPLNYNGLLGEREGEEEFQLPDATCIVRDVNSSLLFPMSRSLRNNRRINEADRSQSFPICAAYFLASLIWFWSIDDYIKYNIENLEYQFWGRNFVASKKRMRKIQVIGVETWKFIGSSQVFEEGIYRPRKCRSRPSKIVIRSWRDRASRIAKFSGLMGLDAIY